MDVNVAHEDGAYCITGTPHLTVPSTQNKESNFSYLKRQSTFLSPLDAKQ